jgi:HEAT repeat protein
MSTTAFALVLAVAASPIAGVDPRVYLKEREPVPHALAELEAAPVELSQQILMDGPDSLLVNAIYYPEGMDRKQREALRALERRALVIGALHVVTKKKPIGAVALVLKHLGARDALVRADAAEQLAAFGSVDAVLSTLSRAAREDVDVRVRESACLGLGKVRSSASLAALTPFVVDETDAPRQRAALRALTLLAAKARGDGADSAALRRDAQTLLAKVSKGTFVAEVDKGLR